MLPNLRKETEVETETNPAGTRETTAVHSHKMEDFRKKGGRKKTIQYSGVTAKHHPRVFRKGGPRNYGCAR